VLQNEGNDAEMLWKTVVNIAEFPRFILASGATLGATFASFEEWMCCKSLIRNESP
jgi:hypothetical protein